MHPIAHLALVSVSCFSLHQLLTHHYMSACHSSFWSVIWSDSAYCGFVHATLKALQWAPITLAGPLLSRNSLAPAWNPTDTYDEAESIASTRKTRGTSSRK